MEYHRLLRIEEAFSIKGKGVAIMPDFLVPDTSWKDKKERVQLKVDGHETKELEVFFNLAHFNYSDPGIPASNSIVVIILDTSEIPQIGSQLFASIRLRKELKPNQ